MTKAELDLSSLDSLIAVQEEGLDIQIEHPTTGEPLGITWRVCGPDSKRAKDAERAFIDKRLAKGRRSSLTSQQIEDQALRQMAAMTISWSGVLVDGEVLECTMANVVAVLRRFPFIREQVDAVVGDRTNFLSRSATI